MPARHIPAPVASAGLVGLSLLASACESSEPTGSADIALPVVAADASADSSPAVASPWVDAASALDSAVSLPTTDAGAGDANATAADATAGGADAGASDDAAPDAAIDEPPPAARLRDVVMVGNSLAGTVSFIDARTFESLGSVDVLPDFDDVMLEINLNPVYGIGYQVVRNQQLLHHFEPGGGDRYVDDLFVSPDGTVLYVSRSNLADVAAFDLSAPNHPLLWRTRVEGFKADHAAISPDGRYIAVSATSAQVADIIDTATGEIVRNFPTGYYPHQNDYTADGRYVYNSSIGNVGYNAVSYADNDQKGDRWLVKADAETGEIVDTWEFEWGIRPNIITPDETVLYTQLSYLNGVVKYDLVNKQEMARNDQPLSDFALETYATYDEYPHDSAHHGLALSGDGTRLCDCGTIDNTVAIVRTADMGLESIVDVGMVPYWATTSPDGEYCFVSLSGDDALSIVSYATGEEVKVVPVGKFPQRSRLGRVPESVVDGLLSSGG